jgi:hypothetical protein
MKGVTMNRPGGSKIERMKKGGRLNPNDAHAFVEQPTATEELGGRSYPSRACGICGGSKQSAIHIDSHGDSATIRDAHGPFGQ